MTCHRGLGRVLPEAVLPQCQIDCPQAGHRLLNGVPPTVAGPAEGCWLALYGADWEHALHAHPGHPERVLCVTGADCSCGVRLHPKVGRSLRPGPFADPVLESE